MQRKNVALFPYLQVVFCSTNLMDLLNPHLFDAGEECDGSSFFIAHVTPSFAFLLTGCCPGSSLTASVAVGCMNPKK